MMIIKLSQARIGDGHEDQERQKQWPDPFCSSRAGGGSRAEM